MATEWLAQTLRLTLFRVQPPDEGTLSKSVVGTDPQIDERRPHEAIRRQAGKVAEASLEALSTPPRLDWFMTAYTAPGSMIQQHFGPFDQAVAAFDSLIRPWLASPLAFDVTRVAVGVVALMPVENRLVAYERLARLVPSVKYDAANSSEVTY